MCVCVCVRAEAGGGGGSREWSACVYVCMYSSPQVVSDTMKYRRENNLRRSDFLQLLLDAQLQEQTNNNKSSATLGPSPSKVTNQGRHSHHHSFYISFIFL